MQSGENMENITYTNTETFLIIFSMCNFPFLWRKLTSERVLHELNWSRSQKTTIFYAGNLINYLKMHNGTNQVSCTFPFICLHVLIKLFLSMALTSPHLSPSPLRKLAQTCHLHCVRFLTHSNDMCSPYNGLKESPDPKVEGQVTSYTQLGTGLLTWQLITFLEVDWASSVQCCTVFCLYMHKILEDLQHTFINSQASIRILSSS